MVLVSPAALHGVLDALEEQGAVGQPGKGVVQRLMGENLLAALAVGHVEHLHEQLRRRAGLVADQHQGLVSPHRVPGGVHEALVHVQAVRAALLKASQRLLALGLVLRVCVVQVPGADDLLRVPAQQLPERRVDLEELTREVGDGHTDRRLLQRAAEAVVSGDESRPLARPLGDVARDADDPDDIPVRPPQG
ncbi:MAG: hypothetical protein M3Q27_18470 [Actinomycetota bacterium]|nr:hypothetical protein [Actinomycetota bacterium]